MILTFNLRQMALRLLVVALLLVVFVAEHNSQETRTTAETAGVRAGNPQRNLVALMINVDWGEEFIPDMLHVLDSKNARVTFFVVGRWANKNPDLLRQMAAKGHQIASHGASHKLCTRLSDIDLNDIIRDGVAAIRDILGKEPAPIFAPPSGDSDARVVKTAERYGLQTILWTLDTVDWKRPPAQTIIARAVDKASPGALVLMHPTKPTLEALPKIIDGLRQKGLEPAVVTEVIAP